MSRGHLSAVDGSLQNEATTTVGIEVPDQARDAKCHGAAFQ